MQVVLMMWLYHCLMALLLLPTLVLFSPVDSSVNYVKPVNQYVNTNANTLDYYLQNATKYFVSNTQLQFLPGIYQLNEIITIKDIYNFSLIGNRTKGSVVIGCPSTGGIAIINSSYINVKHLVMKKCISKLNNTLGINNYNYDFYVSLLIKNSYSISIHQLTLLKAKSYGIVLVNVLSHSTLSEVSSSGIVAVYNNQKIQSSKHYLTITKYYPMPASCFKFHDDCYKIEIVLLDHPHHINIDILDTIFNMEYAISIHSQTCDGFNKITIVNCNFTNVMFIDDVEVAAMIDMYFTSCNAVYYENGQMNKIDIVKCHFNNNFNFNGDLGYVIAAYKDYYSHNGVILHISDSEVCGNNDVAFLMSNTDDIPVQPININFNNVRFVSIVLFASDSSLLNLHGVVLQLEGLIIFTEIEVDSVLIFSDETHVYASGYVEFSNIRAFSIVQSKSLYLITNTLVNVTSNIALSSLFKRDNSADSLYPSCLLQYVGNAYSYNKEVDAISHLNISIIIDDSEFSHFCENEYCTTHCSWSNNTISNEFIPLNVNREVIKNLNNNSTLITDRKDICYCLPDGQYDCYIDEIKSIYPGQTVHLSLINTLGSDMFITVHTGLPTSCS